MSNEVKPCPFCGEKIGPPKSRRASTDRSEGFVAFAACYCGGYSATAHKMGRGNTEAEAIQEVITLWNRRAQPAEAEGVECPVVACISSETGELYREDYGLKDPVYLVLQSDHLAALSAVTVERDALKGALERIVAAEWSSSETATDFAISQTKGFLIWEMKKIARAALQES